MWKTDVRDERLVQQAANLLGDGSRFRIAAQRVLNEWPKSCETNLTADGNRRAWLGQAACYLSAGTSEEATRVAWGLLTPEQQKKANAVADALITQWRTEYNFKISQPGLFDA